MDDAGSTAGFQALFEHRDWVRALAARLCRDATGAEDVEQDTWLEAWRGHASARAPRRWLGGVVRHLSRRSRRRAKARDEREAQAARTGDVPSPETLLAQAELQRRVLAAVASLGEPYRIVVLLHYYEGRSCEDIARQLGAPSSTVRNRLARAHRELRAKLDREYGGERALWSGLFVPALALDSSSRVLAGVEVAMKLQFAVATAAAVVLAAVWWQSRRARPAEVESASLVAAAPRGDPARPNDAPEHAGDSPRSAVNPTTATSVAAVEHVLVSGALHGADGVALVDGRLSFIDARGESHTATLAAGNAYSIFGLRPGSYAIGGWLRGFLPLADGLMLPADQPKVRHDLTLVRALVLPVRFVDRANGAALDTSARTWRSGLAAVATLERPVRVDGVLGRAPFGAGVSAWYANDRAALEQGGATAHAGVLEIWEPAPLFVSCVLRDTVLESRWIRGDETELEFVLDPAELAARLARLELRCVDGASGRPIAGVSVCADTNDGGGHRVLTDAEGRVDVANIGPGLRRLALDAPGFAAIEHWLRFEPGQALDLGTIELLPTACVRGRLVDANGRGVAASIEAFALRHATTARDFASRMSHSSDADGSFTVDRVESARLRLIVDDGDWAITGLDVDASGGEVGGLELSLERGTQVWLRTPPAARRSSDVLLVDGAGGSLGLHTVQPHSGRSLRLRPGSYELQVVVDDAIARRQALVVGNEPQIVEVAAP